MYTKYYGLQEKPFKLTPDPRFLYLSESHKEAMAHLKLGIQERRGFLALTGEVGTGKTTLIYTLINKLNGKTKAVFINNPNLTVSEFIYLLSTELGLNYTQNKSSFLINLKKYLQNALSKDEILLLIIDEAQNLSFELLEEIRLLSNFETPSEKLLQIFLIGQQELNEKLNMVRLRQLKQRICLKYHIQLLSFDDTQKYIKKRLYTAGCRNRNLFTKKAIKLIYKHSKGIPRLINVICDYALLTGYVKEKRNIDHSIIKEVIEEREASYLIFPSKHVDKRKYNPFIFLFVIISMILFLLGMILLIPKFT